MPLLRAPLSTTLEITNRCNLNCLYCFAYATKRQDIPTEKAIEIIDSLLDAGVYRIEISGGEPFLHPGIFKILEHVQKRDTPKWSVSTNGVLFTNDQFVNRLRSVVEPEELVHHFQISIDSHIPKYNEMTRGRSMEVLNGIRNLLDAGFQITIATVVHKRNVSVADQIIDYFYPLGVKHYHYMNLIVPHGLPDARRAKLRHLVLNRDESLAFWLRLQEKVRKFDSYICVDTPLHEIVPVKENRVLKEAIESQRCTAAFTHVTILSNLDVVPCSMARHIVLGNLKSEPLNAIWRSPTTNSIRASVTNPCQMSCGL